jgi:hypothetical protein
MGLIWDVLIALLVGILLTLIFTLGFRRRGPWSNILLFFLVVFLGTWTAGIWIPPVGPSLLGVFWLSPLMVGLILALLLAAAFPSAPRRRSREEIDLKPEVPSPVVVAVDVFFIVLLIVFAAVILVGYLR